MRRWLTFICAFAMFCVGSAVQAFVVSVEACSSLRPATSPVYEFRFDQLALVPDVEVKVTGFAMNPDMTVALTDAPSEANLFLIDDFADADMSVCKSSFGLASGTNITTIKVGSFILAPDVTVQLTDNVYGADYTMFRQAEDFTDEEAAAFFAVLWMRVQDQPEQQPTMSAYQLQYRQNGNWVGGPVFGGRWECSDAQWAPGVIGARCVEVQVPIQ